jgi:hypothetical protein
MPFLFIDYDQGAGGEWFSWNLSKSDQCVTLCGNRYKNGRTKVIDKFGSEFLKPVPIIKQIPESSEFLYDIVLSHRRTHIAYQYVPDLKSIRIAKPIEKHLFEKIKEFQISKVYMSPEVSNNTFLGEIKIYLQSAKDKNKFLRNVRRNMTVAEIILLSRDVEITDENIEKLILEFRFEHAVEPDFNYDLVIPFENLVYDSNWVKQEIYNKFGIVINDGNWLDHYNKNYA